MFILPATSLYSGVWLVNHDFFNTYDNAACIIGRTLLVRYNEYFDIRSNDLISASFINVEVYNIINYTSSSRTCFSCLFVSKYFHVCVF